MSPDDRALITTTLLRMRDGGAKPEELLPLVYDRLREIAGKWFRGAGAQATLQPTALVHEAYLHLVDQTSANWNDRVHFLAVAALAMRQIVIQRARARNTMKRGGGLQRIAIDGNEPAPIPTDFGDVLTLDEALTRLAELHERHAKVVELRFFGGLTTEEIAAALDVSTRTVELDWRAARSWLNARLAGSQ